jgi:hypothetical protein
MEDLGKYVDLRIPGRHLPVACPHTTWVSLLYCTSGSSRIFNISFSGPRGGISSSAQKSDIERLLLEGAQFPATECKVALRTSRLAAAESADPHQSAFLYVLYDIIQTKDT